MTEDEMVGWHHRLDGHEFDQALGVGDEQGGLVCSSPWGCKELDTTEQQCKEIEESNRMGKTRDLFKKIRDTKGIFHAKMGAIKERNGMDLTEAEDLKKRWQKYTKELYKKDLHDPDNYSGDHSPRARHSGMRSLVGLWKHDYEQS